MLCFPVVSITRNRNIGSSSSARSVVRYDGEAVGRVVIAMERKRRKKRVELEVDMRLSVAGRNDCARLDIKALALHVESTKAWHQQSSEMT